jgi:predicted ATP-dependent Lon-type protease
MLFFGRRLCYRVKCEHHVNQLRQGFATSFVFPIELCYELWYSICDTEYRRPFAELMDRSKVTRNEQLVSMLKVDKLTERLQLAMDNGAKKVMLPAENKRDFADIPSHILDKLQIIFYSDPATAAFRAMALE